MATLRAVGIGLLTSCLVGAVTSNVAEGKKPGSDPPATLPIQYAVTWLGDLGGLSTRALGVNDAGIVIGYAEDSNENTLAFVCPNAQTGSVYDLNTLAAPPQGVILTTATCINNAGRIGGMLTDGNGDRGAYVCNADGSELQIAPFAAATLFVTDMSDDGVMIGWHETLAGYRQGFVWDPGSEPVAIDNLWDLTGINDALQIVGTIPRDDKFQGEIFRLTLPDPPPPVVVAVPEVLADATHTLFGRIDINDSGVISGTVSSKGDWRPARFTDGSGWELLRANNKQRGYSEAINTEGHICGRLMGVKMGDRDSGFVFFGVVGHPVDGFWPLDDLVDPTDPWWRVGDWNDDTVPLGMSDVDETGYGMIVGYKDLGADVSPHGQFTRLGFVLTPVPPSQP